MAHSWRNDTGVGVIYTITCIFTRRVYVGQTNLPIMKRWKIHCWQLKRGKHHSVKLQRAWNKYGAAAFGFQVVETGVPLAHLTAREQYYMDMLAGYTHGFNCAPVAACTRGVRPSSETVAKRVAKLKGMFIGRKLSEETKRKIREARAQQVISLETRVKIGNALRGRKAGPNPKKGCKGRIVSPEERIAIATKLRGRAISPEVIGRMKAAQLKPEVLAKHSKTVTPELREKLSAAHKGKPNNQLGLKRSEESRKRMSEAAKLYQRKREQEGK